MKANHHKPQARFQAARLGRLIVLALAALFANTTALGGTIRYDLPELLGEHRYDGQSFWGKVAQVDTPFVFYSATQATLVIEGNVTPGKARGDGVTWEALEFDLEPMVRAFPNFALQIHFSMEATADPFRIEQIYPHPFVTEVTPQPSPDRYPPVSFFVHFWVAPSFATNYPPLLIPLEELNLLPGHQGIIVDVPIIANVTEAYIVLTGPGIVPEPSAVTLTALAAAFIAICITGRQSRLR